MFFLITVIFKCICSVQFLPYSSGSGVLKDKKSITFLQTEAFFAGLWDRWEPTQDPTLPLGGEDTAWSWLMIRRRRSHRPKVAPMLANVNCNERRFQLKIVNVLCRYIYESVNRVLEMQWASDRGVMAFYCTISSLVMIHLIIVRITFIVLYCM